MRALWLTDLHLNFVSSTSRRKFYDHVRATGGEVALVGGDIGEATSVGGYLSDLEVALAIPVYFVLGNHDFYHGSFKSVRGEVAALSKRSQRLTWLTTAGVVPLTESTALIGHDSWGDGRLGEGEASEVMLNDFLLIEDLLLASKRELFKRLYALGDEAARETERNLCEALGAFANIVLLTHVPPFREACWHEGKISGDDFLPHFACKAMGDMLARNMARHADRRLTVLCGHTHSRGIAKPLDNIVVHTGGAEYGTPEIQQILEL